MLVSDVHLAVLDVRVWNIHYTYITSDTDSSSNINISKENTLLLIHISDTWYKATYTTAKKKRPNQLGYLVGIWL